MQVFPSTDGRVIIGCVPSQSSKIPFHDMDMKFCPKFRFKGESFGEPEDTSDGQ